MTKKFAVIKWLMFSLAVLSNGFIIFYSCISEKTTEKWNNKFTSFFTAIVNKASQQEIKTVPVESIETKFLSESDFKYNYIPGYSVNDVPLGSEKQIETVFYPADSTNKGVTYSIEPSDAAILNQSGTKLSIVGMKTGDFVVKAKSSDGGFETSTSIKIVKPVAPKSFEISLDSYEIPVGTAPTLKFDIDGGNLDHNELINFRYFDIRELTYVSSDNNVAKVLKDGTIQPLSTGSCDITVKNAEFSRQISINVVSGSPKTPYENLTISGNSFCYGNDMILDQSSHKNHYQLTPFDNAVELDPEDFVWTSSNDLLVRVDKHGVMRGFKKTKMDDEHATITCISKHTNQHATFNVVVKNQLPTKMNYCFLINNTEKWNVEEYIFSEGDVIEMEFFLSPNQIEKNVHGESSNESVLKVKDEGNKVILYFLKVGNASLTVSSKINPNLKIEVSCDVVKKGRIALSDIDSFGIYIRKSLGHAAVFMVSQIFTFLAAYMFLIEKKMWLVCVVSVGEGLLVSSISEIIQYFVPSRSGTFIDILINFSGVLIGALVVFLSLLILKKLRKKKQNKNKDE